MEPQFIYLRYHIPIKDQENNIVGWERGVNGKGGMCIAYVVEKEAQENGETWVIYKCTFARCCPKDTFNKTIARAKATGRLSERTEKHTFFVESNKNDTREAVTRRIKETAMWQLDTPVELF